MHAVKWSFWGILEEDFTSWLRTCLYGLMTLLLLRNYLEAASRASISSFRSSARYSSSVSCCVSQTAAETFSENSTCEKWLSTGNQVMTVSSVLGIS
jgi:hypothetical protein